MKTINKLFLGLGLVGFTVLPSCSDFDEVNTDPSKTPLESVKAYYTLNQSFSAIQMDPSTGERVYVYNWSEGGRLLSEKGLLSVGGYDDDFISGFYYPCLSSALTTANLTLKIVEATPKEDADKKFYPNLKQFARIWRVYLMIQGADSFGPMPLVQALDGTNPAYSSEKDVYKFALDELAQAVEAIDLSVQPSEVQESCDPYFGYNATNWLKYANSLRMRLAMRLSNIEKKDPEMYAFAKAQFKLACADLSKTISEDDDIMEVVQNDGWNDYAGPYTRGYNVHALSTTMANILTNLGGVSVKTQLEGRGKKGQKDEMLAHIAEDANYVGVLYDQHFVKNTDNPTKEYWMDCMPANLDPRALKLYYVPGDSLAENFVNISDSKNGINRKVNAFGLINKNNKKDTIKVVNCYTWNGIPVGTSSTFSPTVVNNELLATRTAMMNYYPILGAATRNATEKMVYFGPWETYFLVAEGIVRGWISAADVNGMTDKDAYEKGIELSFEHFGVSKFYADYVKSEVYNRVGTSVKYDHNAQATTVQVKYKNGYAKDGKILTKSFQYPVAGKTVAEGKDLNGKLAKIMTQKYIAQMPYLVQECWSDHRRTGLPFFDMPANELAMSGSLDMTDKFWRPTDYNTKGQAWTHYPQRLRYPTSFQNSSPDAYSNALELLGGENTTMTPLWWSLGANQK